MVLQNIGAEGYGSSNERERERTSEAEAEADASAMAAEECCREPRKRRDRRDSGSAHERKERRPHSEERPRPRPRTPPAPTPTPALHDYNRLEVERRAERLSRARRPQYGGKRRRAAPRAPTAHNENECFTNADDTVRCSSPPYLDIHLLYKQHYREDNLDLGLLHRQLCGEGEEPARSAAARRAPPPHHHTARPAPPPRPASPRTDTDKRLEKIKKKIALIKRNIAKHESDFQNRNGAPITQSDRMIDVPLTRMYETLRKLQEEKRSIKTDPADYALKVQAAKQQKERDDKLDLSLKSDKSMGDLVLDIEEWLEGCRSSSGRNTSSESSWTAAQLAAEKSCVQRVLLRMEAARGRPPAHSADRGAARHLYDRYRAVKRALAAVRPDAVMGNGELATIHEHEAMLFNTSVDSSSEERDRSTDFGQQQGQQGQQESSETPVQSPAGRSSDEVASSTSSATANEESSHNEGLHCLTTDELYKLLHNAKLQKSILRRSIKEYEVNFEVQNCRKVQRDDKKGHEEEYFRYKAIKARIKLLNALINKQKVPT